MSLYRESIHLFIFLSSSVLLSYSGYSFYHISVGVYMLDARWTIAYEETVFCDSASTGENCNYLSQC